MIGLLAGKLLEKDFSSCLVNVNGVGYEVQIPLSTFDKLPLENEDVTLFIHTAVREDAITLFGFSGKEEKKLFQQLIGVSGVGGKLALNVLSAMPAGAFCAAISSGD
ncbi:MAG: Holliday junction branch migration protein RuvA, partial [Lentisphaeria bacterium]|nr:Holliday junction branch migration protein RuvA [Lentisphaeria bacterium]